MCISSESYFQPDDSAQCRQIYDCSRTYLIALIGVIASYYAQYVYFGFAFEKVCKIPSRKEAHLPFSDLRPLTNHFSTNVPSTLEEVRLLTVPEASTLTEKFIRLQNSNWVHEVVIHKQRWTLVRQSLNQNSPIYLDVYNLRCCETDANFWPHCLEAILNTNVTMHRGLTGQNVKFDSQMQFPEQKHVKGL